MTDHKANGVFRASLDAHLARLTINAENAFHEMAAQCESPIERQLLAALMFIKPACIASRYEGPGDFACEARLHPQYPLPGRRLDFAYIVTPLHEGWRIKLGIECDGHAYHSTPEQKARDNRRTGEVIGEGFYVIRFTGSEINADPRACAQEIADTVDRLYADRIHDGVTVRQGPEPYAGPVGPLLKRIAGRTEEEE